MNERTWTYARKKGDSSSPLTHVRAICAGCRPSVRSVFTLISGIILIALFLPSLSQSKDTAGDPGAFYLNTRPFTGYYDSTLTGDAYYFGWPIDEDLTAHNGTKPLGEISFLLADITEPLPLFNVDPFLVFPGEMTDLAWPASLNTGFYNDDNLKTDREDTGIAELWSGIWGEHGSDGPETRVESFRYQSQASLPYEEKGYNLLDQNASNRLALYLEPPEGPEPIPQQSQYIHVLGPTDEGHETYGLSKFSEPQYRGNIHLPLSVPRLRERTNRIGIFPDAIYIGTDFDYFSIAESLRPWKPGGNTLPSNLNRLGSEWLGAPSGYIHFEWRLGK